MKGNDALRRGQVIAYSGYDRAFESMSIEDKNPKYGPENTIYLHKMTLCSIDEVAFAFVPSQSLWSDTHISQHRPQRVLRLLRFAL